MSNFIEARIKLCPTLCNRVADALAAYGSKYPSDELVTWVSSRRGFVDSNDQ